MVQYTCSCCEYTTKAKINYNKHLATQKHQNRSWIVLQLGVKVLTAEVQKQKQKPKTKKDLLLEIVQLKKEIAELKSNI